mgnify:CR=1 FL=1|jgi:hypothetical protein
MMAPRESAIVRAILGRLNKLAGCVARKRHGDVYAVAGDPDIYGCYHGRHFELEVKQPGMRPTALQAHRLSQWDAAGARAALVSSVDEAIEVVVGAIQEGEGQHE